MNEEKKQRDTLRKHDFVPKHSLGQNFILDEALLASLADAAEVTQEDDVLEIGPGSGSLTAQLARRARRVLAVEIDRDLLPVLAETVGTLPNVRILQGDILRQDIRALIHEHLSGRCKIVANLPYYITTDILTKLLQPGLPIVSISLMVQREVAEKLFQEPRKPGYGPLSLTCAYYATGETVLEIPAGCFTPPPKVDSCFVHLRMRTEQGVVCQDEALLFSVIRAGFAMRRKTLANNLQSAFGLPREKVLLCLAAAGILPTARGEELDLAGFARLSDVLGCECQRNA